VSAKRFLSPSRSTWSRRLLASLLLPFGRFFALKSPLNFDDEGGTWAEPDIVLNQDPDSPAPPRPLVNNDCEKSHVIYSVVVNPVADCDFFAKLVGLADAARQALKYFEDDFKCQDKDCPKKVAEIVWTGMSCSKDPVCVFAAVLVRFKCVPDL
jgi:hypothetical protein